MHRHETVRGTRTPSNFIRSNDSLGRLRLHTVTAVVTVKTCLDSLFSGNLFSLDITCDVV